MSGWERIVLALEFALPQSETKLSAVRVRCVGV